MSLFSDSALARDCLRRKIPWYCLALTYTGSSSIISEGSGIRACWTPNIWGWICTHPWRWILCHTRHSRTLRCSSQFLPLTTKADYRWVRGMNKKLIGNELFVSCIWRCLPLLEPHRQQQCLRSTGLQTDTLLEPAHSEIRVTSSICRLDSSSCKSNSTSITTNFWNRISKKQAKKNHMCIRTQIPNPCCETESYKNLQLFFLLWRNYP